MIRPFKHKLTLLQANSKHVYISAAIIVLVTLIASMHWRRPTLPVPDQIESVILLSIDGRGIKPAKPGQPTFHNYPVFGETTLSHGEQESVLRALNRGLAEHGGGQAACHWPRHGLRIRGTSKTMDYAICFECENIEIFDGESRSWAYTSTSPQPVLNDVLTRANIELCPGMVDVQ